MYIQNATYKAVPTAGLTFPLAEGTVLTVGDVTGIVPENISLAAPTGLIYLAVGGTIDLTSEANAGVSFTDAEMNALGGDFNFIPVTEAGGSSLPSYTSADKGKVLTIGEGEGETTIIVPEQTVTTNENGGADVPNAGLFSSLSVGDNCILIVNGDSYPVTVAYDDEEGFLYVRTMPGISIYTFAYSEEETRFAAINDGYPVGTTDFVISIVQSVTTVEPKWEGVGGYIHNASSAFESGVMGLLQTAVTTLVQNNKTFAEAYGIILADDDSAAVLAMAQNPTRVNVWHALNNDFVVLRSNDNGNDNGSITVVLPYYEQVVASTLTYFLSITFTMNSSKSCYVRVFVLGAMGTSS